MADASLNLYGSDAHRPFVFEADDETGVSALLIHSFMGTPKEVRALGRLLAGAGITAHGILLPGFGAGSAALARTTHADWIAAANAAWDELTARSRRTVLLGFSLGGAVALHVAARRPPDRLVLLAPLFRIADRRAVALPLLKRTIKELRPFERANFHDPWTREAVLQIDPDLDLDDPAVRAWLRTELRIPLAAVDEVRLVAARAARVAGRAIAPTLVIQGADDRTVRPADTRRLLARLGGLVAYHEVPCDHMLVMPERAAWPRVCHLILEHVAPLLDRTAVGGGVVEGVPAASTSPAK